MAVRGQDAAIRFRLCDLHGPEEALFYVDADVLILMYSILDRATFDSIETRWRREVSEYCPNTPVILVAAKTDLRSDAGVLSTVAKLKQSLVSTEEGAEMAQRIGAVHFVECSAFDNKNIVTVFETACAAALSVRRSDVRRVANNSGGFCDLL